MKKVFYLLLFMFLATLSFAQVGQEGNRLPQGSPTLQDNPVKLWDLRMYSTYSNTDVLVINTVRGKKQVQPRTPKAWYADIDPEDTFLCRGFYQATTDANGEYDIPLEMRDSTFRAVVQNRDTFPLVCSVIAQTDSNFTVKIWHADGTVWADTLFKLDFVIVDDVEGI